jgi:hypothetical protein
MHAHDWKMISPHASVFSDSILCRARHLRGRIVNGNGVIEMMQAMKLEDALPRKMCFNASSGNSRLCTCAEGKGGQTQGSNRQTF